MMTSTMTTRRPRPITTLGRQVGAAQVEAPADPGAGATKNRQLQTLTRQQLRLLFTTHKRDTLPINHHLRQQEVIKVGGI